MDETSEGFEFFIRIADTPSRRKLRLLLVDDSREFVEQATQWLSVHPWIDIVGRAYSGQEALDAVTRLQPDLVLMDVAMAGMNGLETTRRIKQQLSAPRIVMLTLYNIPAYREEAQAAGADGFVSKSALHTELLRAIDSLFPLLMIKSRQQESRGEAPGQQPQ
jgi:DNA-binding NarL/FixJ family response regulator